MGRARELAEVATAYEANGLNFRNRIINGDMRIDQRNNGASITPTDTTFSVDRWQSRLAQTSKYSVQQNAGAVTPPVGFTNYLGVTSLSAYSVLAGDFFNQVQVIEGFNVADFGWGSQNAQSIVLSFWVRSSLTGTFGGAVSNSSVNRSYPFTYAINSANTWEHKTITIPGDTTGTWLTTNGVGLRLWIGLGVGSNFSGTAGSWASSDFRSATGAVSVVGTNGATFYITGVQLEAGSVATPFERRPYGTELALCQRYYEVIFSDGAGEAIFSYNWSGGQRWVWQMKVQKRSTATFALVGTGNWQVVTPTGVNTGISHIGAFHLSTNYYLQGTANSVVGAASAEL